MPNRDGFLNLDIAPYPWSLRSYVATRPNPPIVLPNASFHGSAAFQLPHIFTSSQHNLTAVARLLSSLPPHYSDAIGSFWSLGISGFEVENAFLGRFVLAHRQFSP